ncbi:MAG: glycoside-pentoside-hexuronide (GPH):cation symporter [Clostridiales bacterium]|nr:glycoside-pentoside-hexuronide (GPH):cation symporter [Clostridiales bacterium]
MKEKNELTFGQKMWWAIGQSSGRQFITALVSTYILVFMTDTFGVAPAAAGVIMTVAAIWDAINDPIMGTLVDRTKTRWGTYRPYLLLVPLPWAIVCCMLFAAPELTAQGKIVYAAVLYICYGMLLTALEIPYNAVLPTMTRNEMEKNDAIAVSTFIASIAILIVSSFTTNLVAVFGGDDPAKGYFTVVLIGAVLMVITNWIAFAKCKEKYTVDIVKESPFKGLGSLMKMKEVYPMLAFWCLGCILFQIIMASSIYYCMYYLMNPALISTYMLVISISGMVGVMVLMPFILRKVQGSMKKAVTYTQIVCVVCYLILFFVGGKSIPLLYILTFVACMFSTMTNAFRSMTVVGFTDYVLLEKGRQMNGTISAIGGFSYKCGTAISNAILSFVLAATGYVAGAIGGQTDAFMLGINSVRFLVPLVATVLYIICIQFYPEERMRELQMQRTQQGQE